MKLKCFLFTLLIGMMCFAGLRAETPDLKENSTDTSQMISQDVMSFEMVSNVSIVQEMNFTEIKLIKVDEFPKQPGLLANYTDLQSQNLQPKQITISEFQHYKQNRNPRDGIRVENRLK